MAISLGIIAIILSYVSSKFFPVNKFSYLPISNTNSQMSNAEEKKVDAMINEAIKIQLSSPSKGKEDDFVFNMGTTQDHWKNLGIENAKMSSAKEEKLYLITVELIKAQLEYYSANKDDVLEKVQDLYLPESFAQFKEYIKGESGERDARSGNQTYNKIKSIKFSKPRSYKDLPDRIGIITYVEFITADTNNLGQLFIFKNVNNKWKIEKQDKIIVRLDAEENVLI